MGRARSSAASQVPLSMLCAFLFPVAACSEDSSGAALADTEREEAAASGTPDPGGAGAGASSASACEPARQVSCACVGGELGAQICVADGSAWSACQCPDSTYSGDGGTGGSGAGENTVDATPLDTCETRLTDADGAQILVADSAHNYSFASSLILNPVAVAPASELQFDWSGVTKDMLGHPVAPAEDIGMVLVVLWNLSLQQLERELSNDTLDARDYEVMINVYPADSSATMTDAALSEFGFLRSPIDPDPAEAARILDSYFDPSVYDESNTSRTMIVQRNSEAIGDGIVMLQAITVDPESTNTTVNITDTSTTSEYSVDLQSQERFYVATGQSNLTIDWTDLTVNATGESIDPAGISEVIVAKFDQPPAELEGELFVDLELIATENWSMKLEILDTSLDLSRLETSPGSGERFPGIDDTGTWLLALRCSDCRHPAPWFMTVLSPCTS